MKVRLSMKERSGLYSTLMGVHQSDGTTGREDREYSGAKVNERGNRS
jgi:hypothetical protein